jgi:hypothetical protein
MNLIMATKNYTDTDDDLDWPENFFSFDEDLAAADEDYSEDVEKIQRIIRESTEFY